MLLIRSLLSPDNLAHLYPHRSEFSRKLTSQIHTFSRPTRPTIQQKELNH